MGIHSGIGMGPAFRAYWPRARSGKAMQADIDKRHGRDAETVEARRELQRVAGLDNRMGQLVERGKASGAHPLVILEALADEIREAERRDRALKASKRQG